MEPKTMAMGVVGVLAAVAVGSLSAYKATEHVESIIAVQLPPVATVELQLGPDYIAAYPDGGKAGNVALFQMADGGVRFLSRLPGCVRKPVGSVLPCGKGPNTLSWVDVGELNRFPAALAQPLVNGCESVACGVFYGEDANAAETTLLNSALGGLLLP